MKHIVYLLLSLSLLAQAQSIPKAELGIGYSFARMPVPLSTKRVSNHAITLDATANINRWLGISGEFDAYYHCVAGCLPYSDIARNNSLVVMGGPRIRLARGKYTPWVHALAGWGNMRFSEDLGYHASANGLAAALGGGLDIPYGRVTFRVGQVDYFRTPSPVMRNNVRFSTGIAINLGTRVK